MSRFNTGNPLGSGSPLDLDDNAKNMDEATNSPADTFQDRLGKSRLTWAGIVKAGTGDPAIAVDAADRANEAADRAESAESSVEQNAEQIAQDAAQQAVDNVVIAVDGQVAVAQSAADRAEAASDSAFVNADVYPDIASGLAAVADGEQFQVVDGLGIRRYRNDSGSAVEVAWYPSGAINSLTVNRGKNYPLRPAVRGGVVSRSSGFLLNAILDVAVVGARAGYYYGIRYFKNGVSVGSDIQDGWSIEEVSIDEFEGSVFNINERNVVNIRDYAPDIDRSLGVQTIRVDAPDRELSFYITLDPEWFPEFGTPVTAHRGSDPGNSWVIDPACYFHEPDHDQGIPSEAGSLAYSVDESGLCLIGWKSGDRYLRWSFGPNGANDLPNFSSISMSLDGVSYSAVSSFSTDWLPPLIFNVDSEPEFTDGLGFTGGNHLLVGDMRTARNIAYKLYADGAPVNPGSSGACQKLTAIVVNEVMAANTVSLERYAARQSFAVSFSPGVAEVSCEFRALEDLRVKNDYGPQLVSTGFNDTQLILDGQYAGRIAFDGVNNSGPFSNYPNAWAVILQSAIHGQLVSWLDHSYGVGDGSHVAPSEPRIRGNVGSTKQYHAAIRNMITPLQMAAGDTYQWRGGYALSAPVDAGEGFDSELSFVQDGAPRHAMIVDASDYVVLP